MVPSDVVVRLIGPPQADGEYVGLRGADADADSGEEIVHLHDYERLYREPGLYEHIVQGLLGCRSPQVAAEGLADAVARLGLDRADLVLLDLGAGTGLVGELATASGVAGVIGLDALEAARAACLRDRPGVYRDYLVGDLAAPASGLLARLRAHGPTGLISAGALGGTHAPPVALLRALDLLPTGAPVVLTIDECWTQTDAPFGVAVSRLLDSGQLRLLHRTRFQHRLTTTGAPIHYELFVAAKASHPRPVPPTPGPKFPPLAASPRR